MALLDALANRCESKCEICTSEGELSAHLVSPKVEEVTENQIALCEKCVEQVSLSSNFDKNHLRCLNESMWSQVPSVQVVSYRLLNNLADEAWAQDLIGMMYMDDETMEWAQKGLSNNSVVHKDANGNILIAGDTVTLIQDLNVKGAGFTAKRGTSVKRIRLVPDNAEHIEGKVEGQQIVILTKFVKKN